MVLSFSLILWQAPIQASEGYIPSRRLRIAYRPGREYIRSKLFIDTALTVVPQNEQVKAEVWVADVDAGFVQTGQAVKVKLAAYPFQKYGMAAGRVEYVSPDAAELPDTRERDRKDTRAHVMPPSGFRALVALDSPYLERDGRQFRLNSGMLVSAEIHLGTRKVMEYLLSPVSQTLHEAGREL